MPSYKTAQEFPHDTKTHLTVREVSKLLLVHENTVKNWIHSGKIGAFKKKWRYGVYQRCAWFVPISELKRLIIKQTMEEVVGPIEWHPPKNP